jgi:hypothetical protein
MNRGDPEEKIYDTAAGDVEFEKGIPPLRRTALSTTFRFVGRT